MPQPDAVPVQIVLIHLATIVTLRGTIDSSMLPWHSARGAITVEMSLQSLDTAVAGCIPVQLLDCCMCEVPKLYQTRGRISLTVRLPSSRSRSITFASLLDRSSMQAIRRNPLLAMLVRLHGVHCRCSVSSALRRQCRANGLQCPLEYSRPLYGRVTAASSRKEQTAMAFESAQPTETHVSRCCAGQRIVRQAIAMSALSVYVRLVSAALW